MGWRFLDFTGLSHFFSKLPEKVVTTETTQTISGTKSFSSTILGSVSGSAGSASKDGSGNVIADTYETKADAATHLSKSDAAGTYLSKTDAASTCVQTAAVDQTIAGTKTFSKPIVGSVTGSSGSCTGNAASATKLQTARTINGTSFNGSANITTANWGTARNITITDGTNTSTAVSVNGSANVSLTLPATIKADLTGNAATATKAAQDAAGNTIATTYATKAENNTKANNSEVVHKSGDETIAGTKTFSNGVLSTAVNAFMAQAGGYTILLRNDGHDTYLLMSDKDGTPGSYNSARPFRINNATGVCDINGNAATATKLATARTIALSGAATGTATGFDGSGNITIPVTALSSSAIRAQWYAAYPDGAEAHNAMWGGRDITAAFDAGTVSANIKNGTFKDIFPGDYITKQVTIPQVLADDGTTELFAGGTYTVNWVIADCDYWMAKGEPGSPLTVHHVAIVPQMPIFNANMNAANTTEGGYAGSDMYKKIIPACATGIVNAFGSSHILTFGDGITNSVDTSHASSGIPQFMGTPGWWGEWVSVQCSLMSEKMVYGAPICAAGAMDNAMATRQMSAFHLSEWLINNYISHNRQTWWLRDVVSSAHFAAVGGGGVAGAGLASYVRGVRPFALLR